jgi:hypothetical protein
MKNRLIWIALLALTLTGCSLWPKRVEIGRDSVKPVPTVAPAAIETQKQAADYLADKTEEVKVAAISTGAATNVVSTASEAATVARSLSLSLGPPETPWKAEAERLSQLLKYQEARYDARIAAYRKEVAGNVGKKIEGSGWFSISYFTQWWVVLIVTGILIGALKLYGTLNPVVGLGVGVVERVSGRVLQAGFDQVVKAGENFKYYLAHSALTESDKIAVKTMFRKAQEEIQDPAVKAVIDKLTA